MAPNAATTSRRAAAKKATRLAAEQLESSDEEESGAGPSFGEPTARKGQFKVTYAKKKRSPGKSRSNTISEPPSAKRLAALPLRSQSASPSPQKPRPKPAPVQRKRKPPQPPQPKGKGRQRAEPISLLSDSDEDVVLLDGPPSSAQRRHHQTHSHSDPTLRNSHAEGGPSKKRKYSNLALDATSGSESDLSSLSSLTGCSDNARGQEPAQVARAASASRNHSQPLNAPWRAPASGSVANGAQNDTIDLDEDIVLVFVRLDIAGALSDADDAIWWPAQVVDRGPPWRVSPFGKSPGSADNGVLAHVDVPSPSPEVILPFCSAPRQIRFDEKTYSASTRAFNLSNSLRKKRKTNEADIHTRWCQARDLMLKAYQDANDGVPLLLSRYVRDSQAEYGMFSISADELSGESDVELVSSPPVARASSADLSMYDLPGELVLAKERPKDSVYWPAKLMKISPSAGRKKNLVYEVLFFDGMVKRLEDNKDLFYCSFHGGFKTCKLGEAQNDYFINEGDQDIDVDDEDTGSLDGAPSDEVLRCPSPPPELPAPTAFAHELSVAEQLAYVKPVLAALMNGQYEPAKWRHVDFMKGGKARQTVTNSAWQRGEVSHKEKNELSDCIRRWMRRRLRRQELGAIPADAALEVGTERPGPPRAPVKEVDDSQSERSDGSRLSRTHSYAHDSTEIASSEADVPQSSFVTVAETEVSEHTAVELSGPCSAREGLPCMDPEPHEDSMGPRGGDASVDANDSTDILDSDMAGEPSLDGGARKDLHPSRTLPTYAMLSELDQITYCTSVLLPEAILQLLLWRNGHRTTPDLLPAEEEEQLHALAAQKASETYWVHDIINLKRSIDRKTLPPHNNSTASAARTDASTTTASRLRTRRK